MMDPDGKSVMAGTSVLAGGESIIATPQESIIATPQVSSSLLRNTHDQTSSRDNSNRNTAPRNGESNDVILSTYDSHQQHHHQVSKPVNRPHRDGQSVLRTSYRPDDDETSITSGTSATERQVDSMDISQRSAPTPASPSSARSTERRVEAQAVFHGFTPMPASPSSVRSTDRHVEALLDNSLPLRTTSAPARAPPSPPRTAAAAVVPPSLPPPRPVVTGTRTGSSGSNSGSAAARGHTQDHSSGAFHSCTSSGSASENEYNAGTVTDGSGEMYVDEAADSFYPDDSVLNSILQEQYQNSVIRLPFVPAEVTGQDTTVEPSIEPQVPIAVAPISLRRVAARDDGSSMVQTPMPRVMNRVGNSGVHNPLLAGTGRGGLPTKQLQELRQQGFPVGLALEVSDSRIGFPVRFWSIDNGANMNEGDCKQVKFNPDGRTTVERCSRWTELQGTVEDQIRLTGLMNVNSLFCLRNGETGNRKFSVADPTSKSVANDVKLAVRSVKESSAHGVTPISKHLREFTSRVELLESTLRKQNQKAVCIFSMGDLPTDSQGRSSEKTKQLFVDALEKLGRLPVWIFIRLCTKDEHVTEFYNNLTFTDLPLVVIDDFLSEAKKVYEHNPWLNYPLCLHRSREMGYHNRIFTEMTKRKLNKDELRQFLVIVFGKKAMLSAPDLHTQWNEFYEFMCKLNEKEGNHWKARTRRVERWIDLRKMHRAYRTSGGLLADMLSPFRRNRTPSSGKLPRKQPPYAVVNI